MLAHRLKKIILVCFSEQFLPNPQPPHTPTHPQKRKWATLLQLYYNVFLYAMYVSVHVCNIIYNYINFSYCTLKYLTASIYVQQYNE